MLNICIFGGPGTGKSTTAAGLFHEMKKAGMKTELVNEYAKSLVFSKDFFRIKDQLYVLAKQHHSWFKMEKQVDYLIHDSPFILSVVYQQEAVHLPAELFEQLIVAMYKSYDTLNIFLERDLENHPYEEYGRYQDLEGAEKLDREILEMLDRNDIPYFRVKMGDKSVEIILKIIEEMKE